MSQIAKAMENLITKLCLDWEGCLPARYDFASLQRVG